MFVLRLILCLVLMLIGVVELVVTLDVLGIPVFLIAVALIFL